jgi:hypothetical protein
MAADASDHDEVGKPFGTDHVGEAGHPLSLEVLQLSTDSAGEEPQRTCRLREA